MLGSLNKASTFGFQLALSVNNSRPKGFFSNHIRRCYCAVLNLHLIKLSVDLPSLLHTNRLCWAVLPLFSLRGVLWLWDLKLLVSGTHLVMGNTALGSTF